LGGTLSAQGLDRRVLVKEFSGDLALALARAELVSLGRLQSDWMSAEFKNTGSDRFNRAPTMPTLSN
jgi:phage baseplate assembly protein gpV